MPVVLFLKHTGMAIRDRRAHLAVLVMCEVTADFTRIRVRNALPGPVHDDNVAVVAPADLFHIFLQLRSIAIGTVELDPGD